MATWPVNPLAFGSRISSISDYFQYFRFRKLVVTLHPYQAVLSGSYVDETTAVSFTAVPDVAPTTFSDLVEMELFQYSTGSTSVPMSLRLSDVELKAGQPLKWYRTRGLVTAINDQQLAYQGSVYLVSQNGTSGSTFLVQFTGEIEFSGPVYAGLTAKPALVRQVGEYFDEKENKHQLRQDNSAKDTALARNGREEEDYIRIPRSALPLYGGAPGTPASTPVAARRPPPPLKVHQE